MTVRNSLSNRIRRTKRDAPSKKNKKSTEECPVAESTIRNNCDSDASVDSLDATIDEQREKTVELAIDVSPRTLKIILKQIFKNLRYFKANSKEKI